MKIPGEAVHCVDDFLSDQECQELLFELKLSLWRPSTIVRRGRLGNVMSVEAASRRSETTVQHWFTPTLNLTVRRIEDRVTKLLDIDADQLEWWQCTRYEPGGAYALHLDAGAHADDPAGERQYTVLVVLEAPEAGGTTWFPRLGREFAPLAGRLLCWPNLTNVGAVQPLALHAAMPVVRGRKTILTTWCRARRYRRADLNTA